MKQINMREEAGDMKIENNFQLSDLANKIGHESYGFEKAVAKFSEFEHMKMKWSCCKGSWAEISVSDYLIGQSEEVLSELLTMAFDKMHGVFNVRYSDDLCELLTSDEFRKEQRPIFLSRNGIEREPSFYMNGIPVHYSLNRLSVLGTSSPVMGVIILSNTLKNAPEDIKEIAARKIYGILRDNLVDFNRHLEDLPVTAKEFDTLAEWARKHCVRIGYRD